MNDYYREQQGLTLSVFYLSALFLPKKQEKLTGSLIREIVWRLTQTLQQTYSPLQEVQVAFKVLMTRW